MPSWPMVNDAGCEGRASWTGRRRLLTGELAQRLVAGGAEVTAIVSPTTTGAVVV